MIARWEDAVGLDAPGARDLPSRQRTLRRAFDWGYDLLDHEERALLPRLAAFPGGFDTLAVEAACRGDDGVLAALGVEPIPTLARVVDRSLVSRDSGPAAEPRYSQLMTVRGYLREHLARDGEEEAADLLMANACAALARQDAQFLGAGRSREELDRLERELNNLRAGLDVFLRAAPRGGRSTSRWTSTASGRPAMSARAASRWSGRSARLTCRRARAPAYRPRPAPGIEVCTNRCQAGAEGIHGGELAEPAGVAIGGGGLVYVAGFRNRRISTYAANGTWLRAFGKHVNRLLPGSFKLCVRREFCKPGEDGDGDGALRGPEWLAIDATGNVYVSEFGSRVSVFSAQGHLPARLRQGRGARQRRDGVGGVHDEQPAGGRRRGPRRAQRAQRDRDRRARECLRWRGPEQPGLDLHHRGSLRPGLRQGRRPEQPRDRLRGLLGAVQGGRHRRGARPIPDPVGYHARLPRRALRRRPLQPQGSETRRAGHGQRALRRTAGALEP
jgi:hypothetical protein